jgi:RNA polymerase sigma factor (sigma-70 family)
MPYRSDRKLFEAVAAGDDRAFEAAYERFQQQARLMAWALAHRPDWIDDLVNETWCRAFKLRGSYRPETPFPVWLAGILNNVYREHCRASPTTLDHNTEQDGRVDRQTPERLAAETELLAGLNDCVSRLNAVDASIVRLRFFENKPLRYVAQEVKIAESTLRETRLPEIYRTLQRCLDKKGIRLSDLFLAQEGGELQ